MAGSGILAIPFFPQSAKDTLITPNTDQESSDANQLVGLYWLEGASGGFNRGPTHVIIAPQNITVAPGVPFIEQDNDAGDPIDVYGGLFQADASSGPLIHIDGQVDKYIDHFYGPSWGAMSPISNHPEQVQVISDLAPTSIVGTAGTAFCSQTITGPGESFTCVLSGYQETGAAQTYILPLAFLSNPNVIQSSCPNTGASVATAITSGGVTTVTLPAGGSMTAESCKITGI